MYTRRLLLAAVLTLAAFILLVQTAPAGRHYAVPGARGAGPELGRSMGLGMMTLDRLTTALNLTPEQVARIQAVHQSTQSRRQAIMADTSLTRQDRRAKMRDLAKDSHQQIMSVLTADQKTKLEQLREEKRSEWSNKMSAELGLTAEQSARIKGITDKKKADLKAIYADNSLTREEKAAEIRKIRSAAMDQIRGLLTPEQQTKLDAMHKRARPARAGAGPMVSPRGFCPAPLR